MIDIYCHHYQDYLFIVLLMCLWTLVIIKGLQYGFSFLQVRFEVQHDYTVLSAKQQAALHLENALAS